MKNNSLDDIVKCHIDISNPSSNDVTFDSILLIVEPPTEEGTLEIRGAFSIAEADELLNYGYTNKSEAYVAATCAFSQSPAPDDLKIYARQEGEDIKTALSTAEGQIAFYGIHLTSFTSPEDLQAATEWAEANEKMFAFDYIDIENFPLKNTSYFRTFAVYGGKAEGYGADEQPENNKYISLGLMAKCFGYEPGTETWHLKELSTFVPSSLSKNDKTVLDNKGVTSFRRYGGSNVSFGGKVLSGEWIDVIRFRDWLKSEIQTNAFNVLKVNRKVPFEDEGIGLISSSVSSTLAKGQRIGGIAKDVIDDNGNETRGYDVTAPLASDFTEAERKSRKLTGIKWTARLSGAIHIVEIGGYLTF